MPVLYLCIDTLRDTDIRSVVFPDDGAGKRFGSQFRHMGFNIIVCGKVRDGDRRRVLVQDGEGVGQHVIIVDDLVQTGIYLRIYSWCVCCVCAEYLLTISYLYCIVEACSIIVLF